MSRELYKVNHRIVVIPYLGHRRETDKGYTEHFERAAKDIIEEIKRHVEDIDSISIEWDVEFKCIHCNNTWEEDKTTDEPMCCPQAQKDFRDANAGLPEPA